MKAKWVWEKQNDTGIGHKNHPPRCTLNGGV